MTMLLRKSYSSSGMLCLVFCLGSHDAAMSEDTDSTQCAPGDEFALRIEYAIDDQYVAKGLSEAGAPVSVRGDEKRVVVMRGDSSWERVTGTTWVDDKDGEKIAKEMETMMDTIHEEGGEPTPEQRMRLYEMADPKRPTTAEARPTDRVRVEVPPPDWSFSYDNVKRLGSKYVKTKDLSYGERMLLASNSEFRGYLHQVAQTADIDATGKRSIAGYACEHIAVTRPARFEYCTAEIRGREVDLYRRIEQSDDLARIETAVSVEVGACIDEARFDVPDEVELIER